jgi:hypothetical protein
MLVLTSVSVAADYSVSGFGTAGLSCFSSDVVDYAPNELPDGPGRSQQCDLGLDSKLGIQLDATLSESTRAVMQLTSYHRTDDSYEPEVTLAHLNFRLNDQARLRLGRVQNPNFLYSDYRNVHYAQPWVRPPPEVYGLVTTFLYDGAELIFTNNRDEWDYEIYLGYAYAEFEVPRGGQSGTDDVTAAPFYATLLLERDAWQFKLGYSTGKASFEPLDAKLILGQLRAFNFNSFADQLAIDDKRFNVFTLAARYETPRWFLIGEYASRTIDGFFRDISGAYLTIGFNYQAWKPYVTYARRWSDDAKYQNPVPALASPLDSYVDQLMNSGNSDGYALSVGVSREINESALLKLQLEQVHPAKSGNGVALFNRAAGSELDDELLLSINIDFVF